MGNDVRFTVAGSWPVLGPIVADAMTTGVASWVPCRASSAAPESVDSSRAQRARPSPSCFTKAEGGLVRRCHVQETGRSPDGSHGRPSSPHSEASCPVALRFRTDTIG